MLVTALELFGLNFLTEFSSIVISLVLFFTATDSMNIAMAVAVNLYPIKFRGMATSSILLLGRIGSFVNSNIVGLLLANPCPSVFNSGGIMAISELNL